MLQFTQKQGRVKRKALLLTGTGGLDFEKMKSEVPMEAPQPLPGDAFERMKADPELIAIKKRFAWSVVAVAILIVATAIVNLNWVKISDHSQVRVVEPVVGAPIVDVPPKGIRDTRIATDQRPSGKPQTLDFTQVKALEVANHQSTRPQPPVQQMSSGGAIRTPVPGYASMGNSAQVKATTGAQVKRPSTTAVPALPRSLLRVATSRKAVLVEHDLSKARTALIGFLSAPTSSERLRFVADRRIIEPRLRAFEGRYGESAVVFQSISDSVVVGTGKVSEHDVVLADRRVHRASVIKAEDGTYLVDWPSFVGEGDVEWEDFMERRVATPVLLRVTAELGDVFSGDFADSNWLLCVKLQHPVRMGLQPLYAYVERKSVIGREVEFWLKEGEGQMVPMSVRVKYPSVSPSVDQVSLTEFVAPGWLLRGGQAIVEEP